MAAICFVALAGCSKSELPLVPVQGKVTFNGGPPPAPGTINFMLVSGKGLSGLPNRPGSSTFDANGRFEVSSYKEGDGLLPGTYTAKISCYVDTPSEAIPNSFIDFDLVPQDFRPELVVKEGSEPIEVTFDAPPKKGKTQ